jgi:hypothetical protein
MKAYKLLLTLAVAAASLSAAKAQQLGVDFSYPSTNFSNGAWTLGYEFYVNSSVTVTGLAVYDPNGNNFDIGTALPQSQEVGLWDSSGNLLTSTWVNAGTTPTLGNGWFASASTTPVVLTAGDYYTVGATSGSENYTWNPTGFTSISQISFVSDEFVSGGSLQFPTSYSGVTGWFGGNIVVGGSVPDACPTWMLAAVAFSAIIALRRRALALI